jgi:hypothetical protein
MRLKAQKSKPFGPKEHHINEKKKKTYKKKMALTQTEQKREIK